MRWWWFGPAVTRPGLEADMRAMKEAGIGGFEVQPVYPMEVDNPQKGIRNLIFLSPEFLEALRFTAEKSRELGLRMDLTLGGGWPYGGPHIPGGLAAGKLRCERAPLNAGAGEIRLPPLTPDEKLIAVFRVRGGAETIGSNDIRRIERPSGGNLPLAPPAAADESVLFFISSRTGMQVKRAAVGAEGLVLDHYERAALDRHLAAVGGPLLDALASCPPRAIFCDSLEVFGSDWSPDFLEEFRKRRGYDLAPHLPALVADIGPHTGAVRNDWVLTLTELAEDEFLTPLHEWARKRGVSLRVQAYGTPPVALASARLVDLPEGEGSAWNRFTSTRWASSSGHLLGRTIISSETWTWLNSPAFRAAPLDLKAEADRHFLQGINQLIGHGWPYSPEPAGEPGWHFYAAAALNHHNPWWIVMPDLARYLQRLSFLLRQGRPVNDVALYLPSADARAAATLGSTSINDSLQKTFGRSTVIPAILRGGYGFDFIDDRIIRDHGRTGAGALEINGNRYKVVVLPGVERIPLETYRKLEAFVQEGGRLIATGRTPSLAPGFLEGPSQSPDVRAVTRRLFEGAAPPARFLHDETGLSAELNKAMPPDVVFSNGARQIGFVHRSVPFAEIYFLANTGNTSLRTRACFRAADLEAEFWDPLTGRIVPARAEQNPEGTVALSLEFEPYQSMVLVFSHQPARDGAAEPPAVSLPEAIDLSRDWDLAFTGTGRRVRLDRLRSWTEDPETRFYSGPASYERTVAVNPGWLSAGIAWYLEFGQGAPLPEVPSTQPGMRAWLDAPVRDAAMVYVNGARAGSAWCPPYRVEITPHLRPGENAIRVVVGNLAINRMAAGPPPDFQALIRRYGKRFDLQDMENLQALPSGLLGPIRLAPAAAGFNIVSLEEPAGVGAGGRGLTQPGRR